MGKEKKLSKDEQQLAVFCVRNQLGKVEEARERATGDKNLEDAEGFKELAKKLKKLLKKMEKGLHLEN